MTTTATVTKRRVLVETRVIVEPVSVIGWGLMDAEERKTYLDRWARELMEFFRDHRSMDVNAVYADPRYEFQCSGCLHEWEEYFDDDSGKACCAHCGKTVE